MLAEFVLMKEAASTTFFFLLIISFVDVVGGYAFGVRRRLRKVISGRSRGHSMPAAERSPAAMFRDFHIPGRSPVFACEGMAATSHPLASEAAIATLKSGGTAADAAVAAVALLGVVEPQMTGIGGDCFCLVAKPGAPIWGYNGSGRAAATASAEALWHAGIRAIAANSVHSVTVPGAVEAWSAVLAIHGRFGLDRALAPAIHYAGNGFPVAPRIAYDWALAAPALRADPGASRHFLIDGNAPRTGRYHALSGPRRDAGRNRQAGAPGIL